MSSRRVILLILIGALALAGCSSTKVYRLTDERFPRTENPQDVRLFVGQVQRPHVRIAYVNSQLDREKTVVAKRRQLDDLRRRAAALGAEAVVNVQLLNEKHRGFEMDPTVPFSAVRQGKYDLYFLRGTAIRYLSDEEAQTSPPGLAEYPDAPFDVEQIPEIDTIDPQEQARPEPQPNEGY